MRTITGNVLRRLTEVALPGREELRGAVLRYVEIPGARAFSALGLTPNVITLLGFTVCVAGAVLLALGWPLYGGIVFLLGGILDLFDGALARLTGRASPFGALLDSVFDRLGEAALFVGLGVYYLLGDLPSGQLMLSMLAVLLGLVFSQGVSYLRARGEGLGAFTRSGIMTRTERVIILGARSHRRGVGSGADNGMGAVGHRRRVVLHTVPAHVHHPGNFGTTEGEES